MALISLTKKAADLLGIDLAGSEAPSHYFPSLKDWIVDVVCTDGNEQTIIFYNKLTRFAIPLRPGEYSLSYCMDVFQEALFRLLNDNGLLSHIFYFSELFKRLHLCRNNDSRANGHIGQIKQSIAWGLSPSNKSRVTNSYDLLYRINEEYRGSDNYKFTALEAFLKEVRLLDKPPKRFFIPPDLWDQTIH